MPTNNSKHATGTDSEKTKLTKRLEKRIVFLGSMLLVLFLISGFVEFSKGVLTGSIGGNDSLQKQRNADIESYAIKTIEQDTKIANNISLMITAKTIDNPTISNQVLVAEKTLNDINLNKGVIGGFDANLVLEPISDRDKLMVRMSDNANAAFILSFFIVFLLAITFLVISISEGLVCKARNKSIKNSENM